MANKLKCWKKVQTNKWRGTVSFTNEGKWTPKKGVRTDNVTLRYNKGDSKPWESIYGLVGSPKFKEFETKNQALKFANKYMKKHNTC